MLDLKQASLTYEPPKGGMQFLKNAFLNVSGIAQLTAPSSANAIASISLTPVTIASGQLYVLTNLQVAVWFRSFTTGLVTQNLPFEGVMLDSIANPGIPNPNQLGVTGNFTGGGGSFNLGAFSASYLNSAGYIFNNLMLAMGPILNVQFSTGIVCNLNIYNLPAGAVSDFFNVWFMATVEIWRRGLT